MQHSDKLILTDMNEKNKFWLDRWATKSIAWHQPIVNSYLLKHFDTYCPKVDGRLRAFVPLSGKTVDLRWLAERGCEVVGVELCKQACDEFFEDQQLEYDLITVEGLQLYKAKKYPLELYNCNFFDLTSKVNLGRFHFIWDRGSMVVMDNTDKPNYVAIMKELLEDEFAYLIEAPLYSRNEFKGVPRSLSFADFMQSFGDCYEYKDLEKDDFLTNAQNRFSKDLTSFFWCSYVMLPKSP